MAESFLYSMILLLEEREVDATVMTVFNKAGMLTEVVVPTMLDNQKTSLTQKITLQYHIRQFWDFLQHIGGIGKDEIKLFTTL